MNTVEERIEQISSVAGFVNLITKKLNDESKNYYYRGEHSAIKAMINKK